MVDHRPDCASMNGQDANIGGIKKKYHRKNISISAFFQLYPFEKQYGKGVNQINHMGPYSLFFGLQCSIFSVHLIREIKFGI